MAILRVKEIREMTQEQRQRKLMELELALLKHKTELKKGGATVSRKLREIRRTIARIKTIMREEELKKKSKK